MTNLEKKMQNKDMTGATAPYAINAIHAEREMAAPGAWAYDAEAFVTDSDGTDLFVHVNVYDQFEHFTVSKTAWFGAEFGFDPDEQNEPADADDTEELDVPFAGDPDFDDKLARFVQDHPVVVEDDTVELYLTLMDSAVSKYHRVFVMLNRIVDELERDA